MMKGIVILVSVAVVILAFGVAVDRPSNWVFDPKTLQEIARDGIRIANTKSSTRNATSSDVVDAVIAEVLRRYPLDAKYTGRWLWNNAGGAMGSMTVLHCSLSEYLIVFGTPLGTEGHTGRYHWVEDFFTIIYGEQWAALPGSAEREVYRPGEQHYLPRSTAKQYKMPEACFALEYARGNIPSMLFFGFADLITSTLDAPTFFHTIVGSVGHMIPNLLRGKI